MSRASHPFARLVLAASVLAMGACAAAPEENDNTPLALAGGAWALSSASGDAFGKALEPGLVTLTFDAARISGSGGCNRYQADYSLQGNRLTIGPVGATKRGCMDDRGELERQWFAVLGGPLDVSRNGDRLILRDASGVDYTFDPAPPEPKDAG